MTVENVGSNPAESLALYLSSIESEFIMDYREASEHFINTAFCLLDLYEHAPTICDPNLESYLDGDYGLRISADGKLNVVDPQGNLIAHSFNDAYSQITYIGKLLAVYLEHLQMDDC